MRLKNKTILITGAASGIGKAIATRCLREGAHVIGWDTSPVAGANASRIVDVGDELQVKSALLSLEHLDGLVSSAGIARRATVVNTNSTDWDDVLRVNLRGSFLVSKYALPLMTAGGSIIHMASVTGITGLRNRAAYSASKGAVVALTRSMAIDYAKMGIRVNCLCPGFVRTPLTETLFSDEQRAAALTAIHPLGRLGEPDDIANAAFFLLSDDASWITGQAIAVDGGLSAGNSADI